MVRFCNVGVTKAVSLGVAALAISFALELAAEAAGDGQRGLSRKGAANVFPTWSPDGRKIAFVSNRDSNAEIYVMDANGSNVRRLTRNRVANVAPAWSPDGRRIAFQRSANSSQIYVMNADGSNQHRLTHAGGFAPSWSPDGRKIAFADSGTAADEIYVMNADGSNVRRLTRNADDSDVPAWSPDGRQIAFNLFNNNSDFQIYVMNADGSRQHAVTGAREDDLKPAWSPDGRKIAFSDDVGIAVINSNGGNEIHLTTAGAMTLRGHRTASGLPSTATNRVGVKSTS